MTDQLKIKIENTNTMKIVCVILIVYYFVFNYLTSYRISSNFTHLELDYFTLSFIIGLIYLPIALYITFTKKTIGWYMLTIYLTFYTTCNVAELIIEIINPRPLYHSQESWLTTSRTDVYLSILAPLIFWGVLLCLLQTRDNIKNYRITKQKTIIISTIVGTLLCGFILLLIYRKN